VKFSRETDRTIWWLGKFDALIKRRHQLSCNVGWVKWRRVRGIK